MGQIQTQDDFTNNYEFVHRTHDGMVCLKHKKSKDQYILRTLSSFVEDDINGFQQLFARRKRVHNSHILNIVTIKRTTDKQVCSILHKMFVLMEFPFKNLADQFAQKKAQRLNFTQNELWSIGYSVSLALQTLYSNGFTHEALTMQQIFIDKQGIIKISDPLILGLQKNYILLLKQNHPNVHISPQLMSFLIDCSFFYYQKEKSDIYVLGIILLQCACMKKLEIYDSEKKKPRFQVVARQLQNIKQCFSLNFVYLLEKMLDRQPKNRPNLVELIELIEKESSGLATTKESKVQDKTQRSFSMNRISPTKPYFGTVNKLKPSVIQSKRPKSVKSQKFINYKYQPKPNPIHSHDQQTVISTQSINQDPKQYNYPHPNIDRMLVSKNPLLQMSPNAKTNQHSTPYYPSNDKFSKYNFGGITINYQPQHDFFQRYQPTYATSYYQKSQPQIRHKKQILFTHQLPQFNFLYQTKNKTEQFTQRPSFNSQFTTKPLNIQFCQKNPQSAHQSYNPSPYYPTNYERVVRTVQGSPQQKKRVYSFNSMQISQKKLTKQDTKESFDNPISIRKNFEMNFPKLTQIEESKNVSAAYTIIQQSKSIRQSNLSGSVSKQKFRFMPLNEQITHKFPKGVKHAQSINYNNSASKPRLEGVALNIPQNMENSLISQLNNMDGYGSVKIPKQQKQTSFSVNRFGSIINETYLDIDNSQQLQDQTPKKNQISISPSSDSIKHKIYVTQDTELGRYEGFKVNGKRSGVGRLYFEKGGFYDGEWKENCMEGQGKLYTVFDKITYEGQWKNGQFQGFGRYFNTNPKNFIGQLNYKDLREFDNYWVYYQGNFKENFKDGQGFIQFTNNQSFKGNFSQDKIDGRGQFYTLNGKQIKGVWKDNVLLFLQ